MPVLTRSQVKNINNDMKVEFISNTNNLINICHATKGKENKMRIALEIFQSINKYLSELIGETSVKMCYLAFIATTFNKTTEILDDAKQGNWFNLDKRLVKQFNTELHKSRTLAMSIIKNNSALCSCPHHSIPIIKAKEDIAKMEN